MIRIAEEAPRDAEARECLLDRAMGRDRFLKPSERLREGRAPADGLAFVARLGNRIAGSVRLWHVEAGDAGPALLLGPLAVEPACRERGIGSALMETAVAAATAGDHRAIILVGDTPFYARFGFSARHTRRLQMPAPVLRRRLLGLELEPGALAGAAGKIVATGRPGTMATCSTGLPKAA